MNSFNGSLLIVNRCLYFFHFSYFLFFLIPTCTRPCAFYYLRTYLNNDRMLLYTADYLSHPICTVAIIYWPDDLAGFRVTIPYTAFELLWTSTVETAVSLSRANLSSVCHRWPDTVASKRPDGFRVRMRIGERRERGGRCWEGIRGRGVNCILQLPIVKREYKTKPFLVSGNTDKIYAMINLLKHYIDTVIAMWFEQIITMSSRLTNRVEYEKSEKSISTRPKTKTIYCVSK